MNEQEQQSGSALEVQRRYVLEVLQRFGPVAVNAIPRAWPVTPEHMAGIVRGLEADGMVRFRWDPVIPGARQARITERGRLLLGELEAAERARPEVVAPGPRHREDAAA